MGTVRSGKMAAKLVENSDFPHPHCSHPGFTMIFPKTLKQSMLEKNERKAGEIWEVHGCTMMLQGKEGKTSTS